MYAFTTVQSLTNIKKDASAAPFTLTQRSDGTHAFTKLNDEKRVVTGLEAREALEELYNVIDALTLATARLSPVADAAP